MDVNLINLEGDTKNANAIKSIVLHQLVDDGVINQEQCDLYEDNYQVIIVNRGWFKHWLEKLKKEGRTTAGEYVYKYVKFD